MKLIDARRDAEPVKLTVAEWQHVFEVYIQDFDGFEDLCITDKLTKEDFRERFRKSTARRFYKSHFLD